MNSRLLTAVIPIHNAQGKTSRLREAIQKYGEMDYVLVFDSCNDQTLDEFEEFLNNPDRKNVKFLTGNYGSPGSARNAGLESVESEWVVFWDADDVPHPNVLHEEVQNVDQNRIDLIVTQFSTFKFNELSRTSSASTTKTKLGLVVNPGLWRIVFKTRQAKKRPFRTFRMGEDQLFLAEYLTFNPRIHFSSKETYLYAQEVPGQLTGDKNAISDLSLTLKSVLKLISASKSNRFFLVVMASRQFATVAKNFSWNQWLAKR